MILHPFCFQFQVFYDNKKPPPTVGQRFFWPPCRCHLDVPPQWPSRMWLGTFLFFLLGIFEPNWMEITLLLDILMDKSWSFISSTEITLDFVDPGHRSGDSATCPWAGGGQLPHAGAAFWDPGLMGLLGCVDLYVMITCTYRIYREPKTCIFWL